MVAPPPAVFRTTGRAGFTLVELSIVMVIIGLIIGGVVVGRDLIAASQMRAQVSQFEKYNQAVNTFKLKYGCLPGDCANATDFLSNITIWTGDNGNGDGLIEDLQGYGAAGTYPGMVVTEPLEFWIQLYAAGLTDCCSNNITTGYNVGLNFPQAKLGVGGISALGMNGVNGYFWGINVSNGPGYVFTCGGQQHFLGCLSNGVTGVITPEQAQAFDTKIDDGQATTGRVIAAWLYGGDAKVHPEWYHVGYNCLNSNTPNAYDLTYVAGTACSLFLTLQ